MTQPSRVTLALGAETVLVDRVLRAAWSGVLSQDSSAQRVEVQPGDEDAAEAISQACAPTLFGDQVAVIIRGIDELGDDGADALKSVLADQPDNVWLILTHPGGVKGKGMIDAAKAVGAEIVECKELKKGKTTTDFLVKEFTKGKRKITSDALTVLYDSVGQDLPMLVAATSQLMSDVENDPIGVDDVRQYFDGIAEVAGFAISDAVWDRRGVDAVRSLRQMTLTTDHARVGVTAVMSIASGLRSIVRVAAMPPGASDQDIARQAGVPPWKVTMLKRQWSKWSGDQRRVARAAVELAEADGAMKGGVGAGASLDAAQKMFVLESMVARLTRRD
jgi:DNA polymerase-3 subunit delta